MNSLNVTDPHGQLAHLRILAGDASAEQFLKSFATEPPEPA